MPTLLHPYRHPSDLGAMVSDDFDRADDASLGGNWRTPLAGTLAISSNQAHLSAVATTTYVLYDATFTQNVYAQVSVASLSSPNASTRTAMLFLRAANAAPLNLYRFAYGWTGAAWQAIIGKWVAGSFTPISTNGISAPTLPLTLRAEASGTSLTLIAGGATVASTTDAAISTGDYLGIGGFRSTSDPTVLVDNFEAGDL